MRVNFSWSANSEPEVTGYKIYAGRATGVYDDDLSPKDMGDVLSGYYEVFEWGLWYFALTAYTPTDESDFSAEIQTYVAPIQLSVACMNARLDAIESAIGVDAVLKIRTGAQPVNCAAADTGTVLATMTLPSDWMAAASSGSKGLAGTWQDLSVDASGMAEHFRLYASDGTTCHMQGTVTGAGGGGDLTLNYPSPLIGNYLIVTLFNISDNNT